jgi:hypothetical protein
MPVCEKSLPYELTVSFLLMPDNPGVPHPIKLQAQHRSMFPPGKPIDEEAGRRVAAWAAGATDKPDTAAIEQAFKALGWESDAIDKTVGKPIAEWTPADVNIARTAYRKATAQKAATI